MFNFYGQLSASKSWMNRALILQSWNPQITVQGQSSAADVVHLQNALAEWRKSKTTFDAGHGGTTFRFLAVRLSREKGHFFIKASPELLARPQKDLVEFLASVGVHAILKTDGLEIHSDGWKNSSQQLFVNTENSSQFISAVLLSCIDLPFNVDLKLSLHITSRSYLQLTLELLRNSGVDLSVVNNVITVPAGLKLKDVTLMAELDLSSAFSLVAAGVLAGDVTITNWFSQSTQPDQVFLEIFDQMKINFELTGSIFHIRKQHGFSGTQFNISQAPDLFPVLCALASFAKTPSKFYGAPQLKHKESDRIKKTSELLTLCGVSHESLDDGMIITPNANATMANAMAFDPANDHRMAMAASLFKLKDLPLQILHPESVNKSYPEFFQHIGLKDFSL